MRHSFIYKTARPWPNRRLKRAAIVGHVTPTTVRIWFRTSRPGSYCLMLWEAGSGEGRGRDAALREAFQEGPDLAFEEVRDLEGVRREAFDVLDWSRDTTAVLDLDGLVPGSEYGYALWSFDEGRVVVGQDRIGRSADGRRLHHAFRTLPLPSPTEPVTFGLYSCHRPYQDSLFGDARVGSMEIWYHFAAVLEQRREGVAYVLGGGDQVYCDGVGGLDIWKYLDGVMAVEGGEVAPSVDVMKSWYRDIFRGYWGFPSVQRVFARFPQYMIWDDHELGDGWGSHRLEDEDGLLKVLPSFAREGLSEEAARELIARMGEAGFAVYDEYEHSHNPPTPEGRWDYSLQAGSTATYVLDGRGHRETSAGGATILGKPQMRRFKRWLEAVDPDRTPFVFVVSSVPVLHLSSMAANMDGLADHLPGGLGDDLRDSWEHSAHDIERKELLDAVFAAAARGLRPVFLSGDVHIAAAFRMQRGAETVYQVTSSALSFSSTRSTGWLLSSGVPDRTENSRDDYRFE